MTSRQTFDSKEDFQEFITNNPDVLEQTTARLNKTYYIAGYRIGKVSNKESGNKAIVLKVDRYLTAEKLRKHEVVVGQTIYDINPQ
jgi:hypothetical protein